MPYMWEVKASVHCSPAQSLCTSHWEESEPLLWAMSNSARHVREAFFGGVKMVGTGGRDVTRGGRTTGLSHWV